MSWKIYIYVGLRLVDHLFFLPTSTRIFTRLPQDKREKIGREENQDKKEKIGKEENLRWKSIILSPIYHFFA